jgi:hypothetical protein
MRQLCAAMTNNNEAKVEISDATMECKHFDRAQALAISAMVKTTSCLFGMGRSIESSKNARQQKGVSPRRRSNTQPANQYQRKGRETLTQRSRTKAD